MQYLLTILTDLGEIANPLIERFAAYAKNTTAGQSTMKALNAVSQDISQADWTEAKKE